ncbi:Protein FAR-RED IMPAIRED RESPONSE 1, partial [Ananas comosus]
MLPWSFSSSLGKVAMAVATLSSILRTSSLKALKVSAISVYLSPAFDRMSSNNPSFSIPNPTQIQLFPPPPRPSASPYRLQPPQGRSSTGPALPLLLLPEQGPARDLSRPLLPPRPTASNHHREEAAGGPHSPSFSFPRGDPRKLCAAHHSPQQPRKPTTISSIYHHHLVRASLICAAHQIYHHHHHHLVHAAKETPLVHRSTTTLRQGWRLWVRSKKQRQLCPPQPRINSSFFVNLLGMDITNCNNPIGEENGRSIVASSSFEIDESTIGSSSLMILNSCEASGHANPPNQKKEVEEASETNRTPKKEFPNRRTGCKALMRLRMIEHEKWIVTTFHKEHNHELIVSPSKTRFFRSHRSITNEQKEVINMLSEQNISTSQIMSFMTAREGGMQNIHFTRKDLNSHTSIYKFVIQFEKIVASRYENENLQEFKMKDGQASLWTFNPIEEQARDVYTKNVFMDFRDQLKASTSYRITQMENNTYKVCTIQNPSKPYQHMHSYVVSVHEDNEKVSCNCKMFNYAGILCANALTVMHFVGIHHIPQNYIMKRWTKEAKSGIPSDKTRNVEIVYSSSGRAQWHESLSLIYRKFMNEECQAANVDLEGQVGQVVKDPPQSQCKGKRRPERIKPHAEKVKKSRTCAKCKRKGHNIRTCKEEPIHEDFDGGSSTERDGSVDVNVVVVITVKTVVVLNNWVNVAIVVTFETIVVANIATELEFWVNVAIVVAFETIVVLNVAIVVTFETIAVVNVAAELENW